MSGLSFDDVFEVPGTRAFPNTLVCISARSSWVVGECDEDQFVNAPLVTHLSAAESSFPLLWTDKPSSLLVDASLEVEIVEPDVGEPSAKRVCSSSYASDSVDVTVDFDGPFVRYYRFCGTYGY